MMIEEMFYFKSAYLQQSVHVCVGRDISQQPNPTIISLLSPSEAGDNGQLTFTRLLEGYLSLSQQIHKPYLLVNGTFSIFVAIKKSAHQIIFMNTNLALHIENKLIVAFYSLHITYRHT